ncbi:beta-1,3-galactosyltransferase 1-like [Saccostrea echinata]|uniref:beta-1,3-galactosyltransferase 1-like n=1 Tax=Saccostrea echinata TaxID=191078 RepID=UPI002A82C016|nr:beta-1,3-galactosyltransferase 1-like [Saccostrea echinata]XP_061169254.1 beta-1,3-galactosyltransferase 1-like [Saccostrea echinata]XP_061169255.1 beta-1,3-galactosyltransferase 1-like [Saccostrea echinata]XP_061169256.1 beta-1,3-galactosyltransferase 1-like [Saccostrea echinata]XP_061169257.1 beta-1,3-galactosyltransferase 1-like [Saccostrea echinata]
MAPTRKFTLRFRIKNVIWIFKWIILLFIITYIVCLPFRKSKQNIRETSYKLVQAYIRSGIIKPSSIVPVTCDSKDVYLLIVVPSAVSNFEQRNAIRNTWGNVSNVHSTVVVKFLLGRSPNTALQSIAITESEIYNDIIFDDILETYENLTRKSIAMLRWASLHCHGVQYLLKIDDDMFLNLPRLLDDLKKHQIKNAIGGCKVTGSSPFRHPVSKWRVSRTQYKEDYYPDYIAGTAYLMSGDILQNLFRATQKVPYFIFEDVYITGLCRQYIGATANKYAGFSCGYRDQGPCGKNFRYKITGHHYGPSEIERMWLELQDRWSNCRFVDYDFIYKVADLFGYIFL